MDGFVKTGKNYGRTYSPLFTQEEYFVTQIKRSSLYKKSKTSAVSAICVALVEDKEFDEAELNELEEIIAAVKRKRKIQH